MSSRATAGIDVERALGGAVAELAAVLRGDARSGAGGDSLAGTLAGHALTDSVRGCAVCVIDGNEAVRVAGVAGWTGDVIAGSVWDLAASPVSQVLAGTERMLAVDAGASVLGQALGVAESGQLVAAPLRIGEDGDGEPTSLGALLLVRDRPAPLADDECAFFEDYTSLVAVAMLGAAPAQDWAGRERRMRGNVDVAVDLVGSLDAGQIISRILQRTCVALDASRATLLRLDGEEVVTEGVHDVDGHPAVLDWRGPIAEQPLLLEAMQSGRVVVGDTVSSEGFPGDVRAALGDVRHTMILPLRGRDNATGFMAVFRRHRRPFIHDDSVTLQLLGPVAVLALRNSRLYTDAQAASEAMLSFLNLVVHDLRAPLTVLSGYFDLLRDGTFGDGPQAWQKPMEMIAGKLHETHRLVDDILLAARLESGAVPVSLETLDLNEVISRAAVRSEARSRLAGALIETVHHPQTVAVSADLFQVDRIIDNLINNAINYGGPSPWVRLSVDAAQPPAIRVEDRGVGISSEFHSRIFDRFFRIDNRVPGTGFGLHVGRVLAEACGGSLRVERSAPGEGSVFRLELPGAAA